MNTLQRLFNNKHMPVGALAILGSLLGSNNEAEGAIRPDIIQVINNAFGGKSYKGVPAGTLESEIAKNQLISGNGKYTKNQGHFTDHALTWRNIQDNWSAEQISDAYKTIYNSKDTLVIPNVLGEKTKAKEALWNFSDDKNKSLYMPIAPYQGGFKGITVYDPKKEKVEDLLRKKGYWDGGSISSIFTPSLEEGLVQPVGSGTLSAVNNQSFENTLKQALENVKGKKTSSMVGTSAILGTLFGNPSEANGAYETRLDLPELTNLYGGEPEAGLETPFFDPVDLLLAPMGVIGKLPKALAVASEAPINWAMDKATNSFSELTNMILGR